MIIEYNRIQSIAHSKYLTVPKRTEPGKPIHQPNQVRFKTGICLCAAVGAPLVDTALTDINACCVAYGQSGSGKTFTMQGSQLRTATRMQRNDSGAAGRQQQQPQGGMLRGLIPRTFEKLFRDINNTEVRFYLSFCFLIHTQLDTRSQVEALKRKQMYNLIKKFLSIGLCSGILLCMTGDIMI